MVNISLPPHWVMAQDGRSATTVDDHITVRGDGPEEVARYVYGADPFGTRFGTATTTDERLARELEDAGWPSVADDVREGVPLDTVLKRLREIGEGDGEPWPPR
jgi:hypothetical protein